MDPPTRGLVRDHADRVYGVPAATTTAGEMRRERSTFRGVIIQLFSGLEASRNFLWELTPFPR